jgi:heptosyltransferase I
VPERYLFLRLSSMGDIVNTLPALRALQNARPDAVVDFVAEDRFAGLVRQVEGIERVIEFPRRGLAWPTPAAGYRLFAHRAALRDTEYDVAIDFQGNLKGALQLAAVRARRKLGPMPAREGAHRLYREPVALPRDIHRSCRALGLIAAAGIEIDHDLAVSTLDRGLLPDFKLDRDATRAANAALGSRDTAPGATSSSSSSPIALMHPGSSAFGAMKRWPAASFAALAQRLAREGADVRVTCGPGEEPLAESVVAAAEGAARFVAPLGGFAGLIALLRRVAVFIAGDSGPLHLAAALDVPSVALFGPKDPRVYAPPWQHATVIRHSPPCAPCSLRRCDDPICMTRLPVDAVAAAALEILAAGRAR